MRSCTLATALFATTAFAESYLELLGTGHTYPDAPVLFEQAAHNPNTTSSVPFAIANTDGWTWRVNITNVAVPNATTFGEGSISPDPRVAFTTYDLQWPRTGTLNDQLLGMENRTYGWSGQMVDLNMCAYVTYGIIASRAYTNCSSALGDQCLQSLMSDIASSPSNGQDCTWGPTSTLLGCGDSIGNTPDGLSTVGFRIGNSTVRPNVTAEALQEGQTFFYSASDAVVGTNTTFLETQQNRLQMLTLQIGSLSQTLCMSLNGDDAGQAGSPSASGSASSTSAAPSSTSSSAAIAGVERVVSLGVIGLVSLAAGFSML